ncbi:MAG: hypothetical protein DMD83_10905 [Candidatus Rokuibacteriota bacterium]|nr:MAG: hypothetical protein DMD83_10905 [Candidatus Rokubacteria bacterium]
MVARRRDRRRNAIRRASIDVFTVGRRRVPATVAGIVSLLEPLTTTLLGVVAFGESLRPLGVAGAVLLLASLGLLVPPATSWGRSRGSRPG